MREFLAKEIITPEGADRLALIYEQNVGERAPRNSGILLDWMTHHYANFPEDFQSDFAQL